MKLRAKKSYKSSKQHISHPPCIDSTHVKKMWFEEAHWNSCFTVIPSVQLLEVSSYTAKLLHVHYSHPLNSLKSHFLYHMLFLMQKLPLYRRSVYTKVFFVSGHTKGVPLYMYLSDQFSFKWLPNRRNRSHIFVCTLFVKGNCNQSVRNNGK